MHVADIGIGSANVSKIYLVSVNATEYQGGYYIILSDISVSGPFDMDIDTKISLRDRITKAFDFFRDIGSYLSWLPESVRGQLLIFASSFLSIIMIYLIYKIFRG